MVFEPLIYSGQARQVGTTKLLGMTFKFVQKTIWSHSGRKLGGYLQAGGRYFCVCAHVLYVCAFMLILEMG